MLRPIFEYLDYKIWVKDRIARMPKKGRGQFTALAKHLNTSTANITLIFKGTRNLTLEQAALLSDYFELSKSERRYLILLVNFYRSKSHFHRTLLEEEMSDLRKQESPIMSSATPESENLPQLQLRYQNWRLKACSKHQNPGAEDVFYTAPLWLSKGEAEYLKSEISRFIGTALGKIRSTAAEKHYCFCLDWFEVQEELK